MRKDVMYDSESERGNERTKRFECRTEEVRVIDVEVCL